MNIESINKPFSKGYVLRTTSKHMKNSIVISINKTLGRIPEFNGNSEKSKEIFETLSVLYAMQKLIDEFQKNNKQSFGE